MRACVIWEHLVLYQKTHSFSRSFSDTLSHPLFFFVSLILDRSVGKGKKRPKKEKKSGTRRPSSSAQYLRSLETTRRGYEVDVATMEEKIDVVIKVIPLK